MSRSVQKQNSVRTFHFLANKYGRELLLDVGRIEKLPNFVLDATPHQLSFYDILFISKGDGYFMLDQQKIKIAPGMVIFTSPGQVRQWLQTKPVTAYAVFFEKDFLNHFFTDELFLYRFQFFHQYHKPAGLKTNKETQLRCSELVAQIESEITNLQNDSSHLLRALLYQLLVILNRAYADTYQLQGDTYIHPLFFQFRSLLEKNYITHHRVIDYVQLLQTSPANLNAICKRYSGLSAGQMIHYRQVSEIRKQLRYTHATINELAYRFNFSDPSNFNRFFKKVTGITPQQYRKNQ